MLRPGERVRRSWDLVGLVVAVALIVGLVGFFTVGPGASADGTRQQVAGVPGTTGSAAGSAPASPAASSAAPSRTTTPAPRVRRINRVVKGLRVAQVPTAAELVIRMEARGFEPTEPDDTTTFSFDVASFNILGDSHSRKRRVRSGPARLGPALAMLRGQNVSVAGLQEFQPTQVNRFFAATGGGWGVYPGLQLGKGIEGHNSIIWNKSVWELVDARTTRIPYFGGVMVRMPHVLLRHHASGEQVWFGNYHNPADTRGNAAGHRARATAIEADLARRLTADGTPMIVTGDMNARADFACPFTRMSGMHSADGVRSTASGCQVPGRLWIDWILGSADITFEGYLMDRSAVGRGISDHPMISATATVSAERDLSDCVTRKDRSGTEHLFCPTE